MLLTVLVLDANQRSALAVTRSLGRIPHYEITTADSTRSSLAGCSHFSAKYIQSPSSESEPEAYVEWLIKLQAQELFDLVVPVTEITSQLLLMNHYRLNNIKLPFASYETVMKLANKGNLVVSANSLNVPCPISRIFESSADLNLADVNFPIVLKPCLSKIYTGNSWIATTVRVLSSRDELEKTLLKDTYLHNSAFMLQEFIPGHGAGIFCLYAHGKPLAFFAHQRLREKPPQGGVSVLSESVPIDPLLKEYATALLDGVNWHGVAMIEFRISPDGKAYLMEVNTRFWGSLQLAIDSGVDFPALLVEAEQSKPITVVTEYIVGQRLRWLLGDIDSLYLYLKSKNTIRSKLCRIVHFFTPRLIKCRHEINRWGDLAPARYELTLYLKHLLGR